MSLIVHTARISTRDPDRLDITRKSAGPDGLIFAPSWDILGPAIVAMKIGGRAAWEAWCDYVPAYREEMRASYKRNRDAWEKFLARRRVVLCCYCVDYCRCHRTLLGRFIMPRCGATYAGELS